MLSMRLSLLELSRQQRLSSGAYDELNRIATLRNSAQLSSAEIRQGIRILALAPAGLGVVFFIAANWEAQDPFAIFVLLEGLVAAAGDLSEILCAGPEFVVR